MNAEPVQGTTHAAVAAVQAAWNRAADPWNAAALAAVYTPDALFFGGRPGHFVGRAAVTGYFASYDGVILRGGMDLVEQHIIALTDGFLLAQGYADFRFSLNDGRDTRSRVRTTLLLVESRDGWRIRQHHFSPSPEVPPLGQ